MSLTQKNMIRIVEQKFKVFGDQIPGFQLYHEILLQRPWWKQTGNIQEANLIITKQKRDHQQYKDFSSDKCSFNHLPSNELLTNYLKLYQQFKLQNYKQLYQCFRVTYNLCKEMDKFLNHLHYLECQLLGMDSSEYNYVQELSKQYQTLDRTDKDQQQKCMRSRQPYVIQKKLNIPLMVKISKQQEKINDVIWGKTSSNVFNSANKPQISQLTIWPKNSSFNLTDNCSKLGCQSFRSAHISSLNNSSFDTVSIRIRPQSAQNYTSKHKSLDNDTLHQSGEFVNVQPKNRPQSSTSYKQQQTQSKPIKSESDILYNNIFKVSSNQITQKGNSKRAANQPLKFSITDSEATFVNLDKMRKLFKQSNQKYVPDEFSQTPFYMNSRNEWLLYDYSGRLHTKIQKVCEFEALARQNNLIGDQQYYVVKDCERCVQYQQRKIQIATYTLIKSNGDVYLYDKPIIKLEKQEFDPFDRQLINRQCSYFDDASYVTVRRLNQHLLKEYNIPFDNYYQQRIHPQISQKIKQVIDISKTQLTRQVACTTSFELLEFNFFLLDKKFSIVLDKIVPFPEITLTNSFSICFYPYLIDDMYAIVVDPLFQPDEYCKNYYREKGKFDDRGKENKPTFLQKERVKKIQETQNQALIRKKTLGADDLIFDDEEVMGDIKLSDRRVDGLRFNGGRNINLFQQILTKWTE